MPFLYFSRPLSIAKLFTLAATASVVCHAQPTREVPAYELPPINYTTATANDTTPLLAALKAGTVGGVALDAYEEEEGVFFEDLSGRVLQDDELLWLLTFPNVLVTAHQGFLAREALGGIARVTTENLIQFDSGGTLLDGTSL
jgi:D-lactate dehydrogenase